MKKIICTTVLAFAAFFTIHAQSIELIDTAGGMLMMAQPSYTFNVAVDSADGGVLGRVFYIKNTTGTSVSFQGKSKIIYGGNIDSCTIAYCLGGQCHSAGQPITANTTIPANGTLTANGSALTLDFNDFAGVGYDSKISYTLFKSTNVNDSVNIIITYHIVSVLTGIKQVSNNNAQVNLYPNPASNSVSLSYDLKNNTQAATLKIYNTIGTLVKTTTLENYTNNTKIDISSLDEGVYFYSVNVGGKTVKTNRLVVAR